MKLLFNPWFLIPFCLVMAGLAAKILYDAYKDAEAHPMPEGFIDKGDRFSNAVDRELRLMRLREKLKDLESEKTDEHSPEQLNYDECMKRCKLQDNE